MKRLKSYYMNIGHPHTIERKWIFPLAIGSIVSLFLFFITMLTSPNGTAFVPLYRYITSGSVFVESKLHVIPTSTLPPHTKSRMKEIAGVGAGSHGFGDLGFSKIKKNRGS
ncbi:hypothetical protein CIPAW_13G051200 [Carya illinoinensis]|uniref:Transmembrane protein n=1 Tax=Carya illinoinensis TaxID=32201 RepID=A0A8T1NGC3_CARIL|nr:hypothetical protein CIPAW_13G051200 [Carya illinoinensis]